MRPRYVDLFVRLKDPDQVKADRAYDALLFERAEALPDLQECYRDSTSDPLLRFYAIQLMGFCGDERAIDFILPALDDPSPAIRAEACRALEDLGATDAVGYLQQRTQDVDAGVRQAANEALSGIQGQAAART